MTTPRNRCGPPVHDADFVGREADTERLWRRLALDHVLLSAPRRVGKTSLMHHLQRQAPRREGWNGAVYYSAEADGDETTFVSELFARTAASPAAAGVGDRLRDARLRDAVARVQRVEVASVALELRHLAEGDWSRLAAAYADALAALPAGTRLLVMVDELPVFLDRLVAADPARGERFLAWFRHLRQGRPERDAPVRWLVAGSIGLAPLAARHRWSHLINDLASESLGPLAEADARALLDGLAVSHRVDLLAAERDALLGRLGWPIPFFLQLAFAELARLPSGPDRVDRIFANLCAVGSGKHFAPWWDRLDDELGKVGALVAERMLDAAAARPDGATREAIAEAVRGHFTDAEREDRRRNLLECLEHDGYLAWDGGRWRFRSPLLREVWLARRSR